MKRSRIFCLALTAALLAQLVATAASSPAQAAAVGQTITGSVDAANASTRAKSHRITVAETGRLVATLTWDNPSADLNLFFRKPGDPTIVMATGSPFAESITYEITEPGDWAFIVTSVQGSSDYTLTYETGGVQNLPVAQYNDGEIDQAGTQWATHAINVPDGGTLTTDLRVTEPTADIDLFIYTSNGTRLAANVDDRANKTASAIVLLPGTYEIRVRATSGASEYTLRSAMARTYADPLPDPANPARTVWDRDLQLRAGERVTIDVDWDNPSADVTAMLRAPNGQLTASATRNIKPQSITYIAPAAGTYQLTGKVLSGTTTTRTSVYRNVQATEADLTETVSLTAGKKVRIPVNATNNERLTVDAAWTTNANINILIRRPDKSLVAYSSGHPTPETQSVVTDVAGQWLIDVESKVGSADVDVTIDRSSVLPRVTVTPPNPTDGVDWPMFGRDIRNNLSTTDSAIGTNTVGGLELAWKTNTGQTAYGSPAVVYNQILDTEVVYVGNQLGTMTAIDGRTGERLWTREYSQSIQSSVSVVDGVAYFGGSDRKLHAIDATTGAPICSFTSTGVISSSPLVVDPDRNGPMGKLVYFGDNGLSGSDDGGNMWAIHGVDSDAAADCSLAWKYDDFGDPPGSKPSVGIWSSPGIEWTAAGVPTVVVGGGSPEGAVYAFNGITGARIWHYQTAQYFQDDDVGAGPTMSPPGVNGFPNGVAYIAGKDRIVHALDLITGELKWEFRIRDDRPGGGGNTRSTMALDGTKLYVGYGKGVYALDAVSGIKIWRSEDVGPLTAEVLTSPAITGPAGERVLLAGDLAGTLFALDANTGSRLWSHQSATFAYASFAVVGSRVYTALGDGFVYAWDTTGSVDPRPNTTIVAPAQGATITNTNNLAISGTASDNGTVTKVHLALKDRNTNRWWNNATQAWDQLFSEWDATVNGNNYSSTVPLPFNGANFFLQAIAVDDLNQRDPDPALTTFYVPSRGNPPETTLEEPEFRDRFYFPDGVRQEFGISISGTATDTTGANPGVKQVRVYIRNIEHQEYYCGSDTCADEGSGESTSWSPGFTTVDATLSNPGATTTNWTLTFPTYDHPHRYRIEAWAIDNDDEIDTTRSVVDRICVRDDGDPTCA